MNLKRAFTEASIALTAFLISTTTLVFCADLATVGRPRNVIGRRGSIAFCITSGSAGARTCPNAAGDVSLPFDCVLSIFHDQKTLTGVPSDKKLVERAARQHETRLNQMLLAFGGTEPRSRSAAAFDAKYRSELLKYGSSSERFLEEIRRCEEVGKTQSAK